MYTNTVHMYNVPQFDFQIIIKIFLDHRVPTSQAQCQCLSYAAIFMDLWNSRNP